MAKAIIVNWMDGEHFYFDTEEEAEESYKNILLEYSKEKAETDFSLFILKKEYSNMK